MVTPADFPARIPAAVGTVLAVLDAQGYQTWLVGGCVRDLALGRAPLDFDVSTSARPEAVLDLFDHVFATGLAHGTVTVLIDRLPIEVTTFRSEGQYTDGRRPDSVAFETDILQDLSRRDFTINSMAYHPQRGLLDPFDGWADLQAGRIRTVGMPRQRFSEDALRLMRAVRFTLTYNLTPDDHLVEAIRAESGRISRLSIERITHELGRIMRSPHGCALPVFQTSGILSAVARTLFGLEPDHAVLVRLLTNWIHPSWHEDQTIPIFYLACNLATQIDPSSLSGDVQTNRTQTTGLNGPLLIQTARRLLDVRVLSDLDHRLQRDCRLSRRSARQGQAALYAAGLRLHLDLEIERDPVELATLLRVIGKSMALNAHQTRLCAADGWSILQLVCPDNPTIQRELISLRQQIQLDIAPETPFEIPIVLSELVVTGQDLVSSGGPKGPRLGLLLERLLSLVQREPAHNQSTYLLAKAREWGFFSH